LVGDPLSISGLSGHGSLLVISNTAETEFIGSGIVKGRYCRLKKKGSENA